MTCRKPNEHESIDKWNRLFSQVNFEIQYNGIKIISFLDPCNGF